LSTDYDGALRRGIAWWNDHNFFESIYCLTRNK
jgi:hypothetical protein